MKKNIYSTLFCIIYISVIITSFFSCTKKEDKYVERTNIKEFTDFKTQYTLEGKELSSGEIKFLPQSIGLIDDKVFFCDSESDTHFYVFKIPEFEFVGKFGNRGRGPLDMQAPTFWGQVKGKEIGIYQANLMKYGFYNIEEYLNGTIKDENIITTYMPPEINDAVNIISLNKNKYIGASSTPNGELFVYNALKKELKWKPFVKDVSNTFMEDLLKYDILSDFKRGIIKVNPKNTLVVKTNIFMPYIDIYDPKGNLLFSIGPKKYENPILSNKTKMIDFSSNVYYTNSFLTNNFIYALYRNCTVNEFSNGDCENVEIHVFDWEGNAVKKYILNEGIGPLSPFAVDETNHKIYSVNPKDLDSYFMSFDIKKR